MDKERKMWEKKENSTELQKPNEDVEIYYNSNTYD